jgi:hypothetical protein
MIQLSQTRMKIHHASSIRPIIDKLFSDKIFGFIDSAINEQFSGFSSHYSEDAYIVFCFRGNHFRDSPSRGTVVHRQTQLL